MDEDTQQQIEFKPEETFVISDLQTLRAISDPVRMQIIDTILKRPRNVKEISKILDTNPTRLYYHIGLLETHKLIQVVKTRIVSGVIEKSYQATATNFSLAFDLFETNDEMLSEKIKVYLNSIFNRTIMEILNSFKAGILNLGEDKNFKNANLLVAANLAHMNPEQAAVFRQKLNSLIDEFAQFQAFGQNPETQNFSFLAGFYPVVDLSTVEVEDLKDK